jgi:DNA-binding transcriptional MerR regulator
MSNYTIDQFSKISGLNKILIRTWENRYNFLEPKRTATNIRYYDDEMLIKGIKYSILVQNGYKISKLIKEQEKDINKLLEELLEISNNDKTKDQIYVSKFIESSINFNQNLFEKTYKRCIQDLGIIKFYKNILVKTMNRVSILYLNSKISPSNEHFLSENIRIKISKEIALIKPSKTIKENWVLFLPEEEYHDIGLLFSYLMLKQKNHTVIYLGQNVPRKNILNFKKNNYKILTSISIKKTNKFTNEFCKFLSASFNKSDIYIIDKSLCIKNKHKNIHLLHTIDDLMRVI